MMAGGKGKDDRKQNTLAPLVCIVQYYVHFTISCNTLLYFWNSVTEEVCTYNKNLAHKKQSLKIK